MTNTATTSSVPLPSLSDIINDLVTLRSTSISLSQPTNNALNHGTSFSFFLFLSLGIIQRDCAHIWYQHSRSLHIYLSYSNLTTPSFPLPLSPPFISNKSPQHTALGIPADSASSPSSSVSSSQEKLEKFRASTEKSQREEGVVENGFEVATDFLKMQQQISVSKQEMNTLHERLDGLEKELTEVRELIAFNPIK